MDAGSSPGIGVAMSVPGFAFSHSVPRSAPSCVALGGLPPVVGLSGWGRIRPGARRHQQKATPTEKVHGKTSSLAATPLGLRTAKRTRRWRMVGRPVSVPFRGTAFACGFQLVEETALTLEHPPHSPSPTNLLQNCLSAGHRAGHRAKKRHGRSCMSSGAAGSGTNHGCSEGSRHEPPGTRTSQLGKLEAMLAAKVRGLMQAQHHLHLQKRWQLRWRRCNRRLPRWWRRRH
eukprot:2769479-Prymnesium_polylepis.1